MTTAVDLRAAAVSLLRDYRDSVDGRLNVYPGRPQTILAPHAFIDRMREAITYPGLTFMQRTPQVVIIVVHGVWDGADTAAQRDEFVDGFLAWQQTRFHEAGPNVVHGVVEVEDDPNFIPEWIAPDRQKTYYATQFVLEGYAEQ